MLTDRELKRASRWLGFQLNAPSNQEIHIHVPIAGGKLKKSSLRNLPPYLANWLPELLKPF